MLLYITSVVCVISLTSAAASECVRPVHFHWLDTKSPTNSSMSLFSNNPSTLLNLYTSFESSAHFTNDGRNLRLFCNGYHFVVSTERDPDRDYKDTVLGLGRHSQIWNHYKTVAITPKKIALGRSKERHFNGKSDKWQQWNCTGTSSDALCDIVSPGGKIKHGQKHIGSFSGVHLFSNSEDVGLPQEVYGYVHHNKVDELSFEFGNGRVITCGEGCLYSSNVWKDRQYHVKIRNDGQVWLNQRYQLNQDIFYDAEHQTIYIKSITDVISLDTFYSQILLISKFVLVCFLATYNKKPPLWGQVLTAVMMAAIALEQSWYILELDDSSNVPIFLVWCTWLVIFYTNLFFQGFLYPNSNVGIVLVIQSTFTELDSFELVFIGYSMFAVITTNEIVSTSTNVAHCATKGYGELCIQDFVDFVLSASYVVALAVYHSFVDDLSSEFQSLFGNQHSSLYGTLYWSVILCLSVEWVTKSIAVK